LQFGLLFSVLIFNRRTDINENENRYVQWCQRSEIFFHQQYYGLKRMAKYVYEFFFKTLVFNQMFKNKIDEKQKHNIENIFVFNFE
jgi:hypothetical protein